MRREPRLTSKFKGSRPLQGGSRERKQLERKEESPEAIHGQNPREKRLGSRCKSP